jgi:hypothetical protein
MKASEGAVMKSLVIVLAAACLVLAVAACGGGGGPESAGPVPSVPAAAEATATSRGAEPLTFELWFIGYSHGHGCCSMFSTSRTAEELGIAHNGADFAAGPHVIERLVEALLAGPTPDESEFGFASALRYEGGPEVRLLGVSLERGIATVNLSSDFRATTETPNFAVLFNVSQIVYTVTQFPEIEGVRFEREGRPVAVSSGRRLEYGPPEARRHPSGKPELLDRPVTREDYEAALFSITFEAPSIGAEVTSPIRIAGTANVRDGTVRAVLRDAAGGVLAERVATVSCGHDCRGDYEIEIPFDVSQRQSGVIQLLGGHEIPVTLLP